MAVIALFPSDDGAGLVGTILGPLPLVGVAKVSWFKSIEQAEMSPEETSQVISVKKILVRIFFVMEDIAVMVSNLAWQNLHRSCRSKLSNLTHPDA